MGKPGRPRTIATIAGLCGKCGVNPRVEKQSWCAECFADYQLGHAQTRLVQAEGKGFAAGVEAMRETLAQEFLRLGPVAVSCIEVSQAIRQAPRPQLKA